MRVKIDRTRCTGCLLCEITCSLLHYGAVQRAASAIRVKLGSLDHSYHQPVVCRQCERMLCLKSKGKETDAALKKAFFWAGGPESADDCPFQALFVFGEMLVHCDLCQGDPECIKSCPTGALTLTAGAE